MKQFFFIGSLLICFFAKANITDSTPTKIRLRCAATTINADKQPLYIVNGNVINDSASTTILNTLDPKLIVNIEIFKDAKALEKYKRYSKAANGVIIITTKQTDFGPKPFCKPPEYK